MAETPETRAGTAFRIDTDGTWFHDGRPVVRPDMVRLFARALRRDELGRYWLVMPGEKIGVTVADAPFRAVEMRVVGDATAAEINLRTNVGDWVRLDAAHPLRVAKDGRGPRPYVALGDGLEALIARSIYYELAARAVPGPVGGPLGSPGVWSAGVFFSLEPEAHEPGDSTP